MLGLKTRKAIRKYMIKLRKILELDFGNTPKKFKSVYLDMYKGTQSEVISTTRFDENAD